MKEGATPQPPKSPQPGGSFASPGPGQADNPAGPHAPPLQLNKGGPFSSVPLAKAAGPQPAAAPQQGPPSSAQRASSAGNQPQPAPSPIAAPPHAAAAAARNGSFSEQPEEPSRASGVASAAAAAPADAAAPSPPPEDEAFGAKLCLANGAEHLYLEVAAKKQKGCTPIDRTDSRPPGEFIRRHGFTQPFQLYQVISWVLFGLEIVMFYLVVVPAVSVPLKAVFGVLFGLSAIVLFTMAYRCTSIDPIDHLAFASGPWAPPVAGETPAERQARVETEPQDATRTCNVCGGVQERSKHCRSCNKCVDVFDHHCIWINNCVGKANYKEFVSMLASAAVMVLMLIAMCLYQVIAEALTGESGPYWRQAYQWFHPAAFYAISTIPILVSLPILGLVVQLLLLHIYLIYHHMTTFDYITMRVEEEVERKSPRVRYRACTEWIVIDKKRLRRAKRKASLAGHASEVSQCAPVIGPSLSVELQRQEPTEERKVSASQVPSNGKEQPRDAPEGEALIAKV